MAKYPGQINYKEEPKIVGFTDKKVLDQFFRMLFEFLAVIKYMVFIEMNVRPQIEYDVPLLFSKLQSTHTYEVVRLKSIKMSFSIAIRENSFILEIAFCTPS
jgi:hypothetical protein